MLPTPLYPNHNNLLRRLSCLSLFIPLLNSIKSLTFLLISFIIGICFAKGKTYLDRFQEHLNGNGSVYIKKIIENGALIEDFKTELLGIYPLEECKQRESDVAKTSLYPTGLNGNAGSCVVMTDEVRQKISKSHMGIPLSKEHKQRIREINLGKSLSEEHKQKISVSSKGRTGPMLGKNLSDEHKQKISKSHIGKSMPVEHKQKMREIVLNLPKKTCPHCGKSCSPGTFGRWHRRSM